MLSDSRQQAEWSLQDSRGVLSEAMQALEVGNWPEAQRGFEIVLQKDDSPEAHEGLGLASWWLEDASTAISSRERAYRLFREQNDDLGAGRMASDLGYDHAVFRAELAVASGWLQRAHGLLDDLAPAPEQVWLAFREAELAYHTAGDMQLTQHLAAQAQKLAARVGLGDLEVASSALVGLALVGSGEVSAGMPRLDEATAAVVGGDVHDLKAVAATCCFMIFACERVRDIDRASQWCDQFMELYRRKSMGAYLGFCRAHYASVLTAKGRWDEAERALVTSRHELKSRIAWSLTAVERLGELRRRQGRLDEAAEHFQRAQPHPGGYLGAARVALDRGDAELAIDIGEGVLRRLPGRDRVERIPALELTVRARCATGGLDEADEAAKELDSIAAMVGTDSLLALASHSRGQVSLASGGAAAAQKRLQDALTLYECAGLPFEVSLVGVDLARALHALGRSSAAAAVARKAAQSLGVLGAAVEAAKAQILADELGSRSATEAAPSGGLTGREAEVLKLVARGWSNQEIADELLVSRHTVRRHVSNILVKFGVNSRTAAAAHARDHELL